MTKTRIRMIIAFPAIIYLAFIAGMLAILCEIKEQKKK